MVWPVWFVGLVLALPARVGAQQSINPQEIARPPGSNPLITEGDAHYSRREDGRMGALAGGREISLAIAGYDSAAQAPDNAEARWKLARALCFKGSYTGLDEEGQRAVFDKARAAGEQAIQIVERRVRNPMPFDTKHDPDAAPSYYWAAVAWGRWALATGKTEAARKGYAEKVRNYASAVIGIDQMFEDAGGFRVLGRLHDHAPRIPGLTEWVSHEEAVRNLRQAIKLEPLSLVNRLFLAEALASGSAADKIEAIALAQGVAADAPSPVRLVEELKIQKDARMDLERWKKP
jgi:tetratricopeptide (TPR) repeat protein